MSFLNKILISLNIYDIILLVSLIVTSFFKFRGYKSLPYLFYFILVITFMEVFLQVYWAKVFKSNHFIYVLICMISISYYFYVYYQYFKSKHWSIVILVAYFVWLLSAFYFYNFNIYSKGIVSEPYFIGLTIIFILIFKYAYDILYLDGLRKIEKEPLLYFSLGILFFCVSSFTHILFIKDLVQNENIHPRIGVLLSLTNNFLSLGYLGAALCSKK